jgi:hypothetical protein
MATITLSVGDINGLPRVCMKCGHAATCVRDARFSVRYFQGQSGNVRHYLDRSVTVPVPLCDRHRHHWLMRYLLIGLSLPLLSVLAAGLNVLLSPFRGFNPGGVCCPVLIVWAVFAVVVYHGVIRAQDIFERSITLKGVSPAFVEAVEEQRRDDERTRRAILGE